VGGFVPPHTQRFQGEIFNAPRLAAGILYLMSVFQNESYGRADFGTRSNIQEKILRREKTGCFLYKITFIVSDQEERYVKKSKTDWCCVTLSYNRGSMYGMSEETGCR
jgi:hypothetical protein